MGVGLRRPYLRVVGIQVDTDGPGRSSANAVAGEEEEEFRRVAARPDVYDVIARSIAPSIYGSENIKKAIACLLLGGSRKRCDVTSFTGHHILYTKILVIKILGLNVGWSILRARSLCLITSGKKP